LAALDWAEAAATGRSLRILFLSLARVLRACWRGEACCKQEEIRPAKEGQKSKQEKCRARAARLRNPRAAQRHVFLCACSDFCPVQRRERFHRSPNCRFEILILMHIEDLLEPVMYAW
jgi:hypothetical protein